MSLACTAPRLLTGRITARALRQRSQYRAATTSTLGNASPSPPPRRAVTVTNDTGRVPWSELSVREKAARTTQQSVNLGVLVVAVAMTVGVSYILYTEVFSTESKTAVFNRCTDRIRQDPRCVEILGGPRSKPHDIEAHGEGQRSGWARNRTIASRTETDRIGTTHMHMHFHATGALATGVVNVHMTRTKDQSDFHYHLLALDVPGHERIWLENAEQGKLDKRNQGKMFGVRWW